jgi:hypothetical protein
MQKATPVVEWMLNNNSIQTKKNAKLCTSYRLFYIFHIDSFHIVYVLYNHLSHAPKKNYHSFIIDSCHSQLIF